MRFRVTGRILVAGIGNIFLGDDAFGVEVIKRLARRPALDNVSIVDFGIRSYDLAYALMDDWDLVILVDAVPRGEQPGTIFTIEPDLSEFGNVPAAVDAHSMNPVAVLELVNALGGARTARLLVVGCEPQGVEADENGNMGLSPAVEAAANEAVHVIEELITDARSQFTAA
jgi:hydrogenase maturation protease